MIKHWDETGPHAEAGKLVLYRLFQLCPLQEAEPAHCFVALRANVVVFVRGDDPLARHTLDKGPMLLPSTILYYECRPLLGDSEKEIV